jgi:Cation/multidrug efflux pump
MVRNTFALGSLTLALLLAILGGVVSLFSPADSFLLLLAGILGGIGALGVLIHTVETIFRGRILSVKVGLYDIAFIVILLGSLSFFRDIEFQTWVVILSAPLLIVFIGLMGLLRRSDKPLLLTDNRAMMLNSVMGTFLAIFMLFGGAPTGVEFFPSTDPNRINIDREGPIGMNIEESNRIAQDVQIRLLIESSSPRMKLCGITP